VIYSGGAYTNTMYTALKNIYTNSPVFIKKTIIHLRELYGLHISKKEAGAAPSRPKKARTDKKKNILFFNISGLSFGGTEKSLQIIAKHLDREKYNVYFMYSPKPRGTTGGIRLDGRKPYLEDDVHLIEFNYDSITQSYPYTIKGMHPNIEDVLTEYNITHIM
jgi:hypothetical protein